MKIKWDKKIETIEQKISVDYAEKHMGFISRFVEISNIEEILSSCFTICSEKIFFSYEIRREKSTKGYLFIIWKGIRTGDSYPLMFGRIENEKAKIY